MRLDPCNGSFYALHATWIKTLIVLGQDGAQKMKGKVMQINADVVISELCTTGFSPFMIFRNSSLQLEFPVLFSSCKVFFSDCRCID